MVSKRDQRASAKPLAARVIVYTFSFTHHGSYSSFHRIAHYLPEQRVIDLTWRSINSLPPRISAALMDSWLRYSEYRLHAYLRSAATQCVHYIYPENSLHRSWCWKGHHRLVLTVHQPREYLERMRQMGAHYGFFRGLKVADAVAATDPECLEAYRTYAPQARLELIPHGVDTEFFRPSLYSTEESVILTVGNWLRDYECWAKVVRALLVRLPTVRFHVIASAETVRKAYCALGGRPSRVDFSSGISDLDLRDAYARAQLTFLPLRDSAANNAIVESLAMGLPVVVTDLPATRFYVGAEAGRYIRNNDIEGCVNTLMMLTENAAIRQRMGAAARDRAVAEFSWPRIADRYRALYHSLLRHQH